MTCAGASTVPGVTDRTSPSSSRGVIVTVADASFEVASSLVTLAVLVSGSRASIISWSIVVTAAQFTSAWGARLSGNG